jgi:hypothetical protein
MKKIMRIASILMTISLLLVLPFSVRLLGTWRERSIEIAKGYGIQNFYVPMGLASLTFVCIGLVVTWTTFQEMRRSAWFVLLLVAFLFYLPVLILGYNVVNWWVILQTVGTSELSKDVVRHHVGFVLMILALLLPMKGFFWKAKVAH